MSLSCSSSAVNTLAVLSLEHVDERFIVDKRINENRCVGFFCAFLKVYECFMNLF